MADVMAFDERLRDTISSRLAGFEAVPAPPEALRRAAVTVALVGDDDGGAGVVLCRRGRVGSHQGQWGLPGGRIDAGESELGAAHREMAEEVGLEGGRLLGRLDDYVTRSGYHIVPFVMWCDGRPIVASPAEIRSVHHVPLAELLRPDSPRWVRIPESDRDVLQLPLLDTLLHAPTAAVLYQFAEVGLRGRHTRVADVEEPVFAWR